MSKWKYFGKWLFNAEEYGVGYTEQNVIDELQKRVAEQWDKGTSMEGLFESNLNEVRYG